MRVRWNNLKKKIMKEYPEKIKYIDNFETGAWRCMVIVLVYSVKIKFQMGNTKPVEGHSAN